MYFACFDSLCLEPCGIPKVSAKLVAKIKSLYNNNLPKLEV